MMTTNDVNKVIAEMGLKGRILKDVPGADVDSYHGALAVDVPGQMDVSAVCVDVTVACQPDAPKAFHTDDGRCLQFLTAKFGVDLRGPDIRGQIEARFPEVLKVLQPVAVGEPDPEGVLV